MSDFKANNPTSKDDTSSMTRMKYPFPKSLRVVDLLLSNKKFMSVIASDIKRDTHYVLLDRHIYPSDCLLAEFSCRVYSEWESCSNPLEQGWILLTTAENFSDGYFGAAYWNPNYLQVVIAHKGVPANMKDILQDYQGIWSDKYTSQMSSAATFTNNVAKKLKRLVKLFSVYLTLSITGHSLGGWLAQITSFSTEYLTPKLFEEEFFVRSEKEGFHTHTVVFDSPGCEEMLLKMEKDFIECYGGKTYLSSLLDITIYLSAPNLVNTFNSHLNVGSLYRVFIEDLPTISSSWNFFNYTHDAHDIHKIWDALVFNEKKCSANKIMKIIDWPLVKESMDGMVGKFLSKSLSYNQEEYAYFHKLADCTNYYNPLPDDNEYCTLRYQVEAVEKDECRANIFTQSEFDFLVAYQILKPLAILSNSVKLFFSLEERTKGKITKEQVEKILEHYELKEGAGRGVIKCFSEGELGNLITCVKNILFLFPNIHIEIKNELKSLNIHKNVYKNKSREYLQSITHIELRNSIMEDLSEFLKDDSLQFLQIVFEMHSLIGIKKIHKFLQETDNEYPRWETFFLSLEQLLNLEHFFPLTGFSKYVNKEDSVLFVVECNRDPKEVATFFKDLHSVLRIKPKFKFILVTRKKFSFEHIFENDGEFFVEIVDKSKIKFSDITEHSQKRLLSKKIYFQGAEMKLSNLIEDNTKHIINEETLFKLINNDIIEVGKALPDLCDIENDYIDRIFTRNVKIKEEIKETFRFFINYDKQVDKSKCGANQDIVLISESTEDFDKFCNENENYNIHWLKEEDNRLLWQKSRGVLTRLREFIDLKYVSKYCDIDDRIVIISAEPGAGKTTALTKLAQEMKKSNPYLWVVKINFNDFAYKLGGADFHEDNILEFLLHSLNLNTPLERDLFMHRLATTGKVTILFDGFDEIIPKYKEKVVELLKGLKDSKIEKLYITTRPHTKDALEDTLSLLSYSLKPLSREDQVVFIKKNWSKVLDPIVTEEKYLENYANKLLNSISQLNNDESIEFTGLPLHLTILAEVFQCKSKDWLSDSNLPEKLNLLNLYNIFVKIKHDVYITQNLHFDFSKSGAVYNVLYASFLKKLSFLALSAVFCEEDLNKFLENKIEKVEQFKKQTQEEGSVGFISHFVNGKPIFTHHSFAEFFAAYFLSQKKYLKHQKIRNFLCEQVFGNENRLICKFFDYMVADDENECKVHIAVLNNDRNKVLQLLEGCVEKDFTNARDKVGRTVLHLAAAYGYLNIVKFLLDSGFPADARDIFEWSPSRYAEKFGHKEIAELLKRLP